MVCVSATMETIHREEGESEVADTLGRLRYIEFSAGAAPVYLREKLLELLPYTQIHNTWWHLKAVGAFSLI